MKAFFILNNMIANFFLFLDIMINYAYKFFNYVLKFFCKILIKIKKYLKVFFNKILDINIRIFYIFYNKLNAFGRFLHAKKTDATEGIYIFLLFFAAVLFYIDFSLILDNVVAFLKEVFL